MEKTYRLYNGYEIPTIGFGTFRTPDGLETENSVLDAIQSGYRLIDCAARYDNEASVGRALKKTDVPREELFITSKLWNTQRGYEKTMAAFQKTLDDLQLDYLDLYLIHWPRPIQIRDTWEEVNRDTWRAFEELYEQGKIKAIGVSNFLPKHLESLMKTAKIKPMVNQIEFHPGKMQEDVVAYCKENEIQVEAWAPLAAGKVFEDLTLKNIAELYHKSVAQITLRWIMQKGIIPLPKSVTLKRIQNNFDVFDFEIKDKDMKWIDAIIACGNSDTDPDNADF